MKTLKYIAAILVVLALAGCARAGAEKINAEGFRLYAEGGYDEAVATLSDGIDKYPDYADLYTNRAMAYFESGDGDSAMADLEKSLSLNEENPEAYSNRGYIYLAYGEYQAAIADFYKAISMKEAFELEDGLYYTYLNLGTCLSQLEQYEEALMVYDKAREIHQDDPALLNAIGIACRAIGDNEKALEVLDQALDTDPDYAYAYVNRAGVYKAMGEYEKGLADVLTALELDQSIPQAYSLAGQLYQALGEQDRALNVLSAGIMGWGSYPDLYLQRGDIYYSDGQYDKAILDFSLARDLGDSEGYYGMALCYIKMEQYAEALDSLEDYEKTTGETKPDVLYVKALAYEAFKKYEEAASLLEEALKLEPGFSEAETELAFIKKNFLK